MLAYILILVIYRDQFLFGKYHICKIINICKNNIIVVINLISNTKNQSNVLISVWDSTILYYDYNAICSFCNTIVL